MLHVLEGVVGLFALVGAVWVGVHRPGAPKQRPGYIERNPDSSRLGRWQTHHIGED